MSASSGADPSPPPTGWSRVAERGSLWGLRLTVWCYRNFGRTLSLALVHAIVAYFFLTDRAGRRASRAYLRRVYVTPEGRSSLGHAPGTWASFLHYREFALAIFDRLAIWFGRDDEISVEAHGTELIDRVTEQGRGAIIVGAHLGSFDVMRLLAARVGVTVNVLMYTANAPQINRIFRDLAPDAETRVIQSGRDPLQTAFEIRECVERGEMVAILGDRVEPGDRGRTRPVQLLGDPVELPEGPFLLACLLRCPVFLMLGLRREPGHYEVFTEELVDGADFERGEREKAIEESLTAYAERLERRCLEVPYQWFNFFDYWREESGAREGRES